MLKHTTKELQTMQIAKYINTLASYPRNTDVIEIILHHTVTNNVKTTVDVLAQRGLAYHYLIDIDGDVWELIAPERMAYHAKGYNKDTVGVAFVCGGQFGPPNSDQKESCQELISNLKKRLPTIKFLCGHKHRSTAGKVDPDGVSDVEFTDWAVKSNLLFKKVR